MSVITAIRPQKNNKRVNIYLNGKFSFGLDLESFMKLGLKVEDELTGAQVEKIVREAEFQKVYDKILRFAALRPRSKKEFKDWFRKHKVHKSLHKNLFERLKRLEFLDDKKFAVWWVEQRTSFKPKGKMALKFELIQKGIDRKVIQEVLSQVRIDEKKMATKILEKKAYKWKNLQGFDKRKKMADYLGRRGFDWNTINKVLKDLRD